MCLLCVQWDEIHSHGIQTSIADKMKTNLTMSVNNEFVLELESDDIAKCAKSHYMKKRNSLS